jgi:putative acetyltransferase
MVKKDFGGYKVSELTKMAVTEKFQGLKIGERLALAAINKAKSLGGKSIFLETNSKLLPAIKLYKKLGFEHKAYPKCKSEHYQRADTYMVLEF